MSHTVKSYRYLRLSMVALVLMLAASLLIEWWRTDENCWQPSISAYYYTPAQAILVGTLIAIGVCLVALKGNTEREDVLLNVAGMLAPVVALVPVADPGSCRSVPIPERDASADIANNMTALFIAGAAGLLVAGWIVGARWARERSVDARHVFGVTVSATILVAGVVWFLADRPGFESAAHYTAAVPMFVCIVVVVIMNGRAFAAEHGSGTDRSRFVNRYLAIAAVMVAASVVLGLLYVLADWNHALLWLEAILIAAFACFWLIQTRELWHQGVRDRR